MVQDVFEAATRGNLDHVLLRVVSNPEAVTARDV
jgi:hypothetical protein